MMASLYFTAPTVSPSDFTLVTDTLTATSANFTWLPVENTPENIQGFFRGYKVSRHDSFQNKTENLFSLHFAICTPFCHIIEMVWYQRCLKCVRLFCLFLSQIQFWRVSDPDTKREMELIQNDFDPCPDYTNTRKRRQADGDLVTGQVPDLWPYSQLQAGVLVLNGAKSGALGDIIDFTTPEGCK